jgi:hypothetical protein
MDFLKKKMKELLDDDDKKDKSDKPEKPEKPAGMHQSVRRIQQFPNRDQRVTMNQTLPVGNPTATMADLRRCRSILLASHRRVMVSIRHRAIPHKARPKDTISLSTKAIRHSKVTVNLPRVTAHHKDTVNLKGGGSRRVHQPLRVPPHLTVPLPQCRLAGLRSGIRTVSVGTTSSRLQVARSGTLLLTCPRVPTLLLPPVLPTTQQLDTTSEVSSATHTGIAGMTTTRLLAQLL